MPRLKVEAAKPPRSVTMPPPRLMSREWRLAPFSLRACHTAASVSRFLCTSSAPIIISSASSRAGIPSRCGRQRRWVCSSVRMKSLSWGHFAMACVRLFASPSQRITSCLLILLITNYELPITDVTDYEGKGAFFIILWHKDSSFGNKTLSLSREILWVARCFRHLPPAICN